MLLKNKKIDFVWYIIGEGAERNALEQQIIQNELTSCVVLLGIKENPYPYIKQTTIFVQPSRYEGKSIAIDEAKLLLKPIIVTNFSTVKDQIEHNVTGIIAEINSESIANAIENLLSNDAVQKQLSENLATQNFGTEAELTKLNNLINGK